MMANNKNLPPKLLLLTLLLLLLFLLLLLLLLHLRLKLKLLLYSQGNNFADNTKRNDEDSPSVEPTSGIQVVVLCEVIPVKRAKN